MSTIRTMVLAAAGSAAVVLGACGPRNYEITRVDPDAVTDVDYRFTGDDARAVYRAMVDDAMYRRWIDEWMQSAMDLAGEQFDNLDPDATIVVNDIYSVNLVHAATSQGALAHVGSIIQALERMVVRAGKTHPLLMGLTEGASEANANRQWEVYAKGIKVLQHPVENLIAAMLEMGCEAQGVLVKAVPRFAEVRVSEEYRDAQTDQLRLQNAENSERLGYRNHEEASVYAVGHKPTGDATAEPTTELPSESTDEDVVADEDVAPAEMPASGETDELRTRDHRFTPVGADAGFGLLPDATPTGKNDEKRATGDFDADVPDYRTLLDALVEDEEAT